MYDSKKIREKIADLQASAQALVELAAGEERDFTEEEQAQFDAYMAELGEDGEDKTGLFAKLAKAEKFEAQKASLLKPANRVPEPKTIHHIKPVNRVGHKLKAFRNEEDAYKCGQWYKAVFRNDTKSKQFCNDNGIQMAQTEGTNSAGGFLVPDPLAQAVIDVRELSGVSRRICRVVPMTADTLNLPKRAGGLTVQYPGEASAITLSDKTWGNVALAVVKRATLTKVSSELLADATVVGVIDDLAMEIGRAFALQEDNELINGDGTGTYGSEEGLLDQLGTAGKTTQGSGDTGWSTLVVGDFHTCVGLLPEKYHTGAKWLMRRNFYSTIVEPLKFAAGGNTVTSMEGASMASFLGYPIEFSDQMPADAAGGCAALFGDFMNGVVIGDRQATELATSDQYAFNEDVTTVRGTTRYDIKVHEPGDGSNAGAYVGIFNAAS